MRHWLTAAALAPILVACASSHASEHAYARADEDGYRVLIVNGERIEIGRGADAARAIEEAITNDKDRRVQVHLNLDETDVWSASERAAFAEAMAALASGFSHDALVAAFDHLDNFDFDFDFDQDVDVDAAELRRRVARAERQIERHAERMERHAERMAERGEARALRAELHGRRMEMVGLQAALEGIRGGLEGLEQALERGWAYKDGERTALTDEDREKMEAARDDLERELATLRERLAEARARAEADGVHREVRVLRRDGDVRAWVDGEEITGSDLDALLEEDGRLAGAPAPPEAPEAPSHP
ncbi:MAG: hypothetical protein RKE49_11715 [Oceanicaulis sp.]